MATRINFAATRALVMAPNVLAVLLAALMAVVRLPVVDPAMERLGLLFFDNYQASAPRAYEDAPVAVVDIDEDSVARLGQWPWPRGDIARLTRALTQAGAAVIAYDVVFSEPDRTSPPTLAARPELPPEARATLGRLPDSDAELAKTFAATPTVLGFFLTQEPQKAQATAKAGFAYGGSPPGDIANYRNATLPLAPLADAASGLGFVSIAGDKDAVIRRAPLVARQGETLLPSLSLEALRVAQQAGAIQLKTSDASGEIGGGGGEMVSVKVGDFEVPTTSDGELWLHYRNDQPGTVIPAWRILTGDLSGAALSKAIGGKILFVGAGAIGLRDLVSTPLKERELGVNIHAQAAEQIILGHFLVRPDWARGLEVALLLALGLALALALPKLGAVKGALAGGIAVLLLVGGSYFAFVHYRYLLDPTWPVTGVTLAYLLGTLTTFAREEQQRAYIHRAFDRYLSPELVKRIADDPHQLELGGEERDMTVLFADIRQFSRISESMGPREVIDFLVRFLTPMTDLLLEKKATIDKYIGDAILAFWNAPLDDPDHHVHAARAALDMQALLQAMNAEAIAKGDGSWPGEVRIGVGLNAGACCVGNIGSKRRLSYSLIGDTVNLASRLEGLTKSYGVDILMGGGMADALGDFAIASVDLVRVVGRDHPEAVSVLLGDETVAKTPAFAAFRADWEAAVAAYRAGEFDAADAGFASVETAAASFGLAKLTMIYRDRIAAFRADPPPASWDGVFEAKSK